RSQLWEALSTNCPHSLCTPFARLSVITALAYPCINELTYSTHISTVTTTLTMALLAPLRGVRPSVRPCAARGRRVLVCRAEAQPPAQTPPKIPEWVPESALPSLQFLLSTDFRLQETELYRTRLQQYVESDMFKRSTGWKELPETINGRAAMLGFLVCALREVAGGGPVLAQLAGSPLLVLGALGLLVAASTVPIYKAVQGDYLSALRDTHGVPEGVFTEPLERLHGRLAMLGLAGLLAAEALVGRALL
ncbi:hypothetical protein Agub_g15388, partial [Astrephomene gubernaculifera]